MPRRARIPHVGCDGSGYPRSHHSCPATLGSIEQVSSRVATHRGTRKTCHFEQTEKVRAHPQPPGRTDRRPDRGPGTEQALASWAAHCRTPQYRADEPCVSGATGNTLQCYSRDDQFLFQSRHGYGLDVCTQYNCLPYVFN